MRASDFVSATRLAARSRAERRRSGFDLDWPRTLSFAAITLVSLLLWLLIWRVATWL